MIALLLSAGVLWFGVSAALNTPAPHDEAPHVRILFAPAIVTDQDQVVVEVWVEPNVDNRWLIVAACDGDWCARRSDVTLDGDRAAAVHRIEWRAGLPAGELRLVAAVGYGDRELARATRQLIVVRRGVHHATTLDDAGRGIRGDGVRRRADWP